METMQTIETETQTIETETPTMTAIQFTHARRVAQMLHRTWGGYDGPVFDGMTVESVREAVLDFASDFLPGDCSPWVDEDGALVLITQGGGLKVEVEPSGYVSAVAYSAGSVVRATASGVGSTAAVRTSEGHYIGVNAAGQLHEPLGTRYEDRALKAVRYALGLSDDEPSFGSPLKPVAGVLEAVTAAVNAASEGKTVDWADLPPYMARKSYGGLRQAEYIEIPGFAWCGDGRETYVAVTAAADALRAAILTHEETIRREAA